MDGALHPDNTTFVVLSFEGPDAYAQAGGLGIRVRELTSALAEKGFPVHLIFVGDPGEPGHEVRSGGRLTLHRWCQWISRYHPAGVYQGEEAKRLDFTASAPGFIFQEIVRPAMEQGRLVAVMGEEWQTAEAMCRMSDLLWAAGLRERAVLLWNANNVTGFERIDWVRLALTTAITTVSGYMKHEMWSRGVNPLVIPNGISKRLLTPRGEEQEAMLRSSLGEGHRLCKVARWDPDKRWLAAVEAVARLKAQGQRAVLVARGGLEPHGAEVLGHAHTLGLSVRDVRIEQQCAQAYGRALAGAMPADVLNITTCIPEGMLQLLYRACDAVLANSGREPFGLVGLEAMAAGGTAFTGHTGEDYASHLHNAIVLETEDPEEVTWYLQYLAVRPAAQQHIRREGRATASQFTWDRVAEKLLDRIGFLAARQGALPEPAAPPHQVASAVARTLWHTLAAAEAASLRTQGCTNQHAVNRVWSGTPEGAARV